MTTTPDTQIGVRPLEVFGEFKPFGLIAEALDGNPIDDAVSEKYDYFLFDPQVVAPRDESDGVGAVDDDSGFGDGAEHELFIRGNRIIWTSGSRVLKKLTLKSSAIMACWCRLGDLSQVMLCVLEVGSLTIFDTSGEFTSMPLPGMITSIWPLPFGLLLQQAAESRCPVGAASTSSSLLSSQNSFSSKKELRHSPMQNHGLWNYDSIVKGTLSSTSSHLVLNGLLEEPQNVFVEERGSLNVMHDFDERTIWTSDYVPLMASFNREKLQHSVWSLVRASTTQREKISSLSEELSPEAYVKQFSLRRIWVAKVSRKAAAKVFLATDDDAVPVICFFLQEQKRLMLVRLSNIENGDEVLIDIKLQISWIESVVAAEPVAVTLSRAKAQGFPVADIIALAPEGVLLLYSGKQCLCKFMLPSCFGRPQVSLSSMPSDCITLPPVKVVGLADAARSRINVILNSGQMLRCSLHRGPPCSLTNDCMKALAAGLCSSMYNRFLRVLWGHETSLVLKHDNYVSYEWKLFSSIIKLMIGMAESSSDIDQYSAWDFLVNSEFHSNYGDGNFMPFRETGNVTDLCFASSTRQEQLSHEKPFYKEFLIECLSCLHATYENLKLIYTRKRDLELLVVLLFGIADFLGEEKYVEHYVRDFPFLSSKARSGKMVFSQRVAPSLYRWLKNCLMHGLSHTKTDDIPLLVCKEGSSVVGLARKVVAFYSLLSGERCVSKKLASGVYCNVASGSVSCPEEQTVLAMVGEGFGLQQLDLLPVGLSLPLRHALFKCRECPPSDWPEAAYILLGREDLALSCTSKLRKNLKPETQTRVKYYSESVPYILQLSPVAIPATMSGTFGSENCKLEDADSVDGPVTDGMEHIFNSSTRLRYGRDLRLNEVRCLLSSSRPVPIHACVNSSASEQELQQARLWQISQRTTALPLGRGAFTLATTCSLLTEALAVPKLVLAGRLPTQQNAMVNLDHNLRNVQDLQVWPEFHNAVAAGLCLAPMQGKMSRTWILYNRSEESSPMHAGLLLALGLHGHLTVLTITDVYRYYQQEHESTTVGLMLGLAASYRGTMELTMSKSFYVHLPSKHPSSFPELEVPTLIQSAALMSLGLLSEGSAHPLTMNYLLGEIGRRSGGDSVLEREGYAVSAGFALGIVVLGLGKDCLPWIESTVDRLFHFAGDRAFRTDISSLLPIMDESRGSSQVVEGVPVNVDVTAPGAIVALALMFLKTESEVVASRLSIPSTHFELQYVRPDFIMLRVIARNLIMWSRIEPSKEWIESQIPPVVSSGIECLRNDMFDMEDVDEEALVQAYVNIVTGLCISLGLKYAGSRNENAKELLYYYAIHFLNEIKPVSLTNGSSFLKGISKYVDRGTLEMCLHLTVLALSVVMAGSGNLEIFRFLKFLRSRNPADAHASYGMHMAASLAIGFLFLGGGMLTFSTSSHAIAALLITLYPRLPSGPNDNRCHLQAYRHMYVLATEPRCIQTVDVDTGLPVYAPLEITVKETDNHIETSFCEVTPCILPERANLKAVRVCGPRYWPQVIELVPEDKAWWGSGVESHPFNSGILYVKRKVGACSYLDDPIGCQSLLSRAMHKAFSLTSTRACRSSGESASVQVDQLVSVFSSDPSLIAFSQLCCDPTWNNRSDNDFQEFCLQVLFDCVSKDRPALLQVYLSLYTAIRSLADQVHSEKLTDTDSLLMLNLKLALAYSEALLKGKLTSSIGRIVQPVFLSSMRNRVEEIFSYMPGLKDDFSNYMISGTWPTDGGRRSIFLAWYLQWFDVPSPSVVQQAVERIQQKLGTSLSIPLLHLLLPKTHITVITAIHKIFCSIQG